MFAGPNGSGKSTFTAGLTKMFNITCPYILYIVFMSLQEIQKLIFRESRAEIGGHDVPEDKIVSRYHKALDKMKEVLPLCDIVNVYDNSITPYRIFKKRKDAFYYQDSELWSYDDIYELTAIDAQKRDLNKF